MKKMILCLSLMVLALSAACNQQVESVDMNDAYTFNANYIQFNGEETETLDLMAGQRLYLVFDVTVDSGAVILQLIDPNRLIEWEAHLGSSTKDDLSYPVEISGPYTLRLIGDEVFANVDLRWVITD